MNKIKRILIIVLALAAIAAACLVVTSYSEAKEFQNSETIVEEIEIIDAEDIGVATIESNIEDEEEVFFEEEEEEDVYTPSLEEEEENEVIEVEDEEEVSVDAPEGLCEGYHEGVYFEPNCFDCEIHEYCYKCEVHEIQSEYFYDEDINPDGYVYSEFCTVCGHGDCTPVTEEEYQEYLNSL